MQAHSPDFSKTLPLLSSPTAIFRNKEHIKALSSGDSKHGIFFNDQTPILKGNYSASPSWIGEDDNNYKHEAYIASMQDLLLSGGDVSAYKRRLSATKLNNSLAIARSVSHNHGDPRHHREEHWSSDLKHNNSKGQFRLPSITTVNGSKKGIPTTQTTMNALSIDLDSGSSMKRIDSMTGSPGFLQSQDLIKVMISPKYKAKIMQAKGMPLTGGRFPVVADHMGYINRIDSKISLEDSLAMEIEKDRNPKFMSRGTSRDGVRRNKQLSHINTTRTSYIVSSSNINKATSEYIDSVLIDELTSTRNGDSDSRRTAVELKGRDDFARMDSDLRRLERLERADTQNYEERKDHDNKIEHSVMGTTIVTISEKSICTVYTQEAPSRYMSSLKSLGSGMRVVEGDLEYYGTVKKLHLLGGGSQAKVYLCKIKEFEELVALKQYELMKSQTSGTEAYNAIKDEFHMLRQLDHENVIQYYCLYRSKKKTYSNCVEFGVIMEYMSGGSLEALLEADYKSISFAMKKSILKQILQGLDYLHKNDIMHRDLKVIF